MTCEEFTEIFDTVAEAPGGVDRLRELVLQLAVQARLVPQDSADEPASRLIESAIEQKLNLIRQKRTRKRKPDRPLSLDEIPFEIPRSWIWVRLNDIAHDLGQMVPDEPFSYIDTKAVDNRQGLLASDVSVIAPNAAPSRARKLVRLGSVIYSTVRPYLLNVAVIDRKYNPKPIASTAFAVLHPYAGVHSRLLLFWLRSPFFVAFVTRKMKGVAYPAINDADLLGAPVPLPPAEEQNRIVAKVDELMGLIDLLEDAQSKREELRSAARDSALDALRNASTTEEVRDAWTRIADRMDELFVAPTDLDPLREAVLQVAVQGRLVRQDPNEEPASRSIERIAKEKMRLVKAKKIGKQKPLPPLDTSARDFELPPGWTWTFTAAVGILTPRNEAEDDAMVSFCPMPTIPTDYRQKIAPESRKWGDIKKGYTHFAEGDVVVAKITPCFQNRKSCVMSGLNGGIGAGTTELHVIRILAKQALPEYLLLFYKSPNFIQVGVEKMTGTAGQQRVPREYFAYTPLPLPPLAEQSRIVAKVGELMRLIDELEVRLVTRRKYHKAFAAAAINQATGPKCVT